MDAAAPTVAAAVRQSLGTAATSIEPTQGGHHGSWFAVAGGMPVVIKSSPMVQFEAWAARSASEHRVPAAEVLAVEPAGSSPFAAGHLISRRLTGTPVRELGQTRRRPALVRRAGAVLRRVHEVAGTGFGHPDPTALQESGEVRGSQATWPSAVETWVESHLEHLVPAGFDASTADEVRAALAAHGPRLAAQRQSTLLHGDFTHRHVMAPARRGRRITGVLDFDGGLFGAPAYDLAVWSIATPDVADLVAGYEPDPAARPAIARQLPLYRLVRYVAEVRWAQIAGVDLVPPTRRMRRELMVVLSVLDG